MEVYHAGLCMVEKMDWMSISCRICISVGCLFDLLKGSLCQEEDEMFIVLSSFSHQRQRVAAMPFDQCLCSFVAEVPLVGKYMLLNLLILNSQSLHNNLQKRQNKEKQNLYPNGYVLCN